MDGAASLLPLHASQPMPLPLQAEVVSVSDITTANAILIGVAVTVAGIIITMHYRSVTERIKLTNRITKLKTKQRRTDARLRQLEEATRGQAH